MDERVLHGPDCIAEGADWLAGHDPRFAAALAQTGTLPTRLRGDGFDSLLSAIVSQQISVASAASVWKRLGDAGLMTEQAVSAVDDDTLRGCGLSRPKIRYVRALADAQVNYTALHQMPSGQVIKTLTTVTGIGQWTAEIYAMFSLGRADVFAHGDLALQESAKILFQLDHRPSEKEMVVMAQDWSPWRSVAARLLWAYYRIAKKREGIRE